MPRAKKGFGKPNRKQPRRKQQTKAPPSTTQNASITRRKKTDKEMDEELEQFLIEDSGNLKQTLLESRSQRIAIAFAFVNRFKAIQEITEDGVNHWIGAKGIIPQIRNFLGVSRGTDIRHILESVILCRSAGTKYDGSYRSLSEEGPGQPPIIRLESQEAQIIADLMEDGASISMAWMIVNSHREEQELTSLTRSAVYSCIKRLRPEVTPVTKLKQGSSDPNDPWSKARAGWVKQLLIRFGILVIPETEQVPDCFDVTKLNCLDKDQAAWWDETHRSCNPGAGGIAGGARTTFLRFHRDENGRLDPNGTLSDSEKTFVNCKYTEEVRLSLGCATVTPVDATTGAKLPREGRRCIPFDYSAKTILTIKDYKGKQQKEMSRVKGLTGHGGGWVQKPPGWEAGQLYYDDPVNAMQNCGKVAATKLAMHGIRTVGDMKSATNEVIENIVNYSTPDGLLPRGRVAAFTALALACSHEKRPGVIDYRKEENPYEARYGSENWEAKMKGCASMSPYICITSMIEHIIHETAATFKGTTHEDDWVFFHDALSLMTAKETVEWMRQKDYLKRWILPEQQLHFHDPQLKRYRYRPTGDGAELMSWDNSLNKDTHECTNWHIQLTTDYDDDDARKFSLSTPKRGSSAYRRLLHPVTGVVPSSKRILQDCDLVYLSMRAVLEAKGCAISELSVRTGHRAVAARAGGAVGTRGGKRTRKQAEDDFGGGDKATHVDAIDGVDIKLSAAKARFSV